MIEITSHDPLRAYDLLRGVADYASTYGPWRFVFRPLSTANVLELIMESRAAGTICHVDAPNHIWDHVRQLGRPVVGLHPGTGDAAGPLVEHDNFAAGQIGALHFIERGLKQLAFAGVDAPWSRAREAGFLSAAGDRHVTLSDKADGRWTMAELHEPSRVRQWTAALTRPVGIMAAADTIAAVVIEACEQLNLRVPEEVAVLGVDNNVVQCEFTPTPFSSVALDTFHVGYEAARMLDAMMRGEPGPQKPVLVRPTGVVVRRSTALPLFADRDLNDAVQFIRDHAHEGIRVQDILRQVPISRRSLERKFQTMVGRSPDMELRRVRLDRARDLLTKTDMTLVEIAVRCGFSSLSYLSQAFKNAFGLPPSEYRRRERG